MWRVFRTTRDVKGRQILWYHGNMMTAVSPYKRAYVKVLEDTK